MPEVTITYLEMKSPGQLKAKPGALGLTVCECRVKQFQVNRFMYQLVGGPWQWTDKLTWPDAQWQAYAESDDLRTWIAYQQGSPAGYYELRQGADGDVEIAYFGLTPKFIGQGLGGELLTHALESAWAWEGTQRVWVHTCTLDHPSALPNYEARGLVPYRRETVKKTGPSS